MSTHQARVYTILFLVLHNMHLSMLATHSLETLLDIHHRLALERCYDLPGHEAHDIVFLLAAPNQSKAVVQCTVLEQIGSWLL